ncbi:MAG: M20 family metallopeptidase [Anaerolineae bacterium]|nr:M20 family metallopeptidase [Anaerolineae bacterium]
MIDLLEKWVNQSSPTYSKSAVDTMGRMTVDAFVEAGATLTAAHPQPNLGDHYTLTFGEGERQILLLCHFDTVWPLDEVTKRPFTLENGCALGPGVHDMKAGTLIGLFALKALRELDLNPACKLVWLLTSDEEIGSPSSRGLIEAESRKSNYCLVLEGSHNSSRLTTARKGVGRFYLEVTGRAAHAGVEPEKGVSAIEELAYQIQTLHAMTDLSRGITVNVGLVSGGERSNVVAARAKADVDVRMLTRSDAEQISEQILNLTPHLPGCQLKVWGEINRWPFEETPAGLALYDKAKAIAQDLGFTVGKFRSGGAGTVTFPPPWESLPWMGWGRWGVGHTP